MPPGKYSIHKLPFPAAAAHVAEKLAAPKQFEKPQNRLDIFRRCVILNPEGSTALCGNPVVFYCNWRFTAAVIKY